MTTGSAGSRPWPARAAPALVGAVSLIVYVRTLLPGMAFGDWGEMQTVPHVLGIPHPTGYPTYVILAWLAQLVPIESVAFRANLLSAVLVSGALAVTVSILMRLGVRPVIAAAGALLLGAVPTVWAAATVAEVNALHLLFVTLLVHRALLWQARRAPRDLVIGGLILGLATGNHLLTLFVAPILSGFVLWIGRREVRARPWVLGASGLAAFLGLSVYLYIPIAASLSPPLAYNRPVSLDAVLWLVSGTQFRGQFDFLTLGGPSAFVGSLPELFTLVIRSVTPAVPILAVVGLIALLRSRSAFGLTAAAILVTHAYLWANYLRLEHYLLVAWLILAITAAVGLESLAGAVQARSARIGRRDAAALVGVAGLVCSVSLGALHWPSSDRSGDRTAEAYVDALFQVMPQDAVILTEWDVSTPLWHAQLVLGRRPDILVVDDTNIVYDGWGSRERRIEDVICDRPVYILRIDEADLGPTRAQFRLDAVANVSVARGGPSAVVTRRLYRAETLGPATCPGPDAVVPARGGTPPAGFPLLPLGG